MEKSAKKQTRSKQVTEVTTYPVSYSTETIKDNISIDIENILSKEQIIYQAFNCHSKGNTAEAAKYYQYLIDNGSNDHRVYANLSLILEGIGKLKEAELLLHKAIAIKPDKAEFHSNLADILNALGKLEEAELALREAIKLNPDSAIIHSNLGSILKTLGKLEEAELFTRKAIELNPNHGILHSNLGSILIDVGKLEEAELSLRMAINLQPDYADAYYNLSLIQLLQGNYHSGLENYEFRFKKKKPTIPHAQTTIKKLNTEKLQKGEKLLVISEQGIGDTLQYMRYIPYLKKLGFNVSFCPQQKLNTIIKASAIDQNPITPAQARKVSEGKWIPLLSLPRFLEVSPTNPIVSKPYIYSNNELTKKWKKILSEEKKPIIGINWQGNPNAEKNYQKGRSLPLEAFSFLTEKNNFKFLSLQKGFGAEQLNDCSFHNKFVECQDQVNTIWDFLENASIIENCDLIITSDTAIAHLAGGMGKPIWILLKQYPEWRWGDDGESTFWYPTMKLFRQKEQGNWNEVMMRVSKELEKEIKNFSKSFIS